VDAAGTLYVANHCANSITAYAPGADGDIAPVAAIVGDNTGLSSPSGVALSASAGSTSPIRVISLARRERRNLFERASGNVTPLARIAGANTGLAAPAGIALDAAGNIYVPNANAAPADITVYAAAADGAVAPTSTIVTRFVAGYRT